MKRLVKLCLLASTLVIASCSLFYSKPPAKDIQQVTKDIKSFTQLSVKGNINLNINTGKKKSLLTIEGDTTDIAHVKALVSNDKLFISVEGGHPRRGPLNVIVGTKYLHSLFYRGKGKIYANRLNSRVLDVNINTSGSTFLKGKIGLRQLVVSGVGNTSIQGIDSNNLDIVMIGTPRVNLSGMANLKRLNFSGSGWLGLYWINSPKLTIRGSGNAYAQLAGVSGIVHMELKEAAHLNGKYLRIDKAFVKTHQSAIAEIAVLKSQNTVANDQSNIFYYNSPKTKADFMAYNGAVLDMQNYS